MFHLILQNNIILVNGMGGGYGSEVEDVGNGMEGGYTFGVGEGARGMERRLGMEFGSGAQGKKGTRTNVYNDFYKIKICLLRNDMFPIALLL